VGGKTNEHKAALELLGVLPLAGKVVTGDALFCQKDVRDKVLEGGGDYLWTVKDNQPRLHFDVAALFAESAAFSPLPATPVGVGAGALHHPRQGARPPRAADADRHAGAARLPRMARGAAGVPDPPRPRVAGQGRAGDGLRDHQPDAPGGGAGAVAALSHGHWEIEHRLHGVRDVTLGADACRVRSGSAPQVLAATRNAVVHLLDGVDAASKAAALRRFAIHPLEALALLIPGPDNSTALLF
jgi:predicted transposase YbfD/YdcC